MSTKAAICFMGRAFREGFVEFFSPHRDPLYELLMRHGLRHRGYRWSAWWRQ